MSPRTAPPPRIPHAEFQRHLGSGGFADVYLYRQKMPERDIAVKVIRPDASAEENGAFEAEANLMAKMSAHPAILSVFGAGVSEDQRSYLIMEYCPPPHLGARARKQQLPVTTVLDIGIRIAGAVETLHRSGVLHRDIKPANILITQFGHPVLTDFGIAVSTQQNATASDSGFSIPWAPPEQALGNGAIGPTVDVYSLAATLHTLLTGHSPFEVPGGDNREITMLNRVLRDPVPSTQRSDVPPELERILAIAMAKDPQRRYPTVLEFAQALQQIQEDMHQRPTPIDVLEDRVNHHDDDQDDDATRVRAVTTIDAGGYAPSTSRRPQAVAPDDDDDATRAAVVHITPVQSPVVTGDTQLSVLGQPTAPIQRWGDQASENTILSRPPAPAQPPADPGQSGVGQSALGQPAGVQGASAPSQQTPAYTVTPGEAPASPTAPTQADPAAAPNGIAHPGAHPAPAQRPTPNPAYAGVAHAPAAASPAEEQGEAEDTPQRGAGMRILAGLLVGLLIVGVVAFGVWSYLRNEGGTRAPDGGQSAPAPDGLPVEGKLESVTGLKGTFNSDGKVTFTWDAAETGEYLFRVVDPIEAQQIRQTTDTQVIVEAQERRTCLEVYIRYPNGKTSERAIECVDTP